MNQDAFSSLLHKEHLDWLNSKLSSKQNKLALMKDVVAKTPDFNEAEKLIIELQTDVAYCEKILEFLKKNFNQQSDYDETDYNEIEEIDDADDLTEEQNNQSLQSANRRDPMDMLRPQYRGMSMFDIIDSILSSTPTKLSGEEVTNIAYDTNSDDEFKRAKDSISAQLRNGANQGKWLKLGRGYFAGHGVSAEELGSSFDVIALANNRHFPLT